MNLRDVRLLRFTIAFGITVLVIFLLYVGKNLLIPFLIAIVIWYLIHVLTDMYRSAYWGQYRLPYLLALFAALLTFSMMLLLLAALISQNISEVIAVAPTYQVNLEDLTADMFKFIGIHEAPNTANITDELNLAQIITSFITGFTAIASNTGIILLYVVFILFEQKSFWKKIKAMARNDEQEEALHRVIKKIDRDLKTYIGVKTLVSLLTGITSYIILKLVAVDFAAFWAVVIFFFNYIPNIGSILATIFPSVLTLVQFDTMYPFIVVTVALSTVQIILGNVLEPRLMGRSLNLSPMVIFFSLAFWGSIWGVLGMFLCVPITVITMVIVSHFRQTRIIAILLSEDGQVYSTQKPKVKVSEPSN